MTEYEVKKPIVSLSSRLNFVYVFKNPAICCGDEIPFRRTQHHPHNIFINKKGFGINVPESF